LGMAVAVGGYGIWGRRSVREADVVILLWLALGLVIVAAT